MTEEEKFLAQAIERLENGYELTKNASKNGPNMRIEHQNAMIALAANHIALGNACLELAKYYGSKGL